MTQSTIAGGMNAGSIMPYAEYCQLYPDHPLMSKTYTDYLQKARLFLTKAPAFNRVYGDGGMFDFESFTMSRTKDPGVDFAANILIEDMEKVAVGYSSEHWRLLRKCLQVYFNAVGQRSVGDRVLWANKAEGVYRKNPVPVSERRQKVGRERRMLNVTADTMAQIYIHFSQQLDTGSDRRRQKAREVCAMLTLAYALGIRPAESCAIAAVRQEGETLRVSIGHVKNTALGEMDEGLQRGISREIENVPRQHEVESDKYGKVTLMPLEEAVEVAKPFDAKVIDAIRGRVRYAERKLRPGKKRKFCLYSLRYTFGSNLKAEFYGQSVEGDAKWGIKLVAAMLGHKNTNSMSRYGSFRSGRQGSLRGMRATSGTLEKVVLSKHHRKSCNNFGGQVRYNPRQHIAMESVARRDQVRAPSSMDDRLRGAEVALGEMIDM